jgi:hypothetical protein
MNARHFLFVFTLFLLGLAGGWLLTYSTPQGLGLNDDSIAYIAGARSILDGQGYREAWLVSNGPVTHFPPGYPAVLALLGFLTGLDPLRGARVLNSALFGLNVFLAGWLGWRMTGSRLVGLLVAAGTLLSSSLLYIHARAMSEPLYIFLTLLSFLVLDEYFVRSPAVQLRVSRAAPASLLLVTLGCLLGWAYLARYAALSLLATMLAGLLILHENWRKRWQDAALLALSAFPWMLGWSIRNRVLGGSFTNRVLSWHPVSFENWELGVETLAEFIVPFNLWRNRLLAVPGLFEGFLLAIGLALFAWVVYKGAPRFLRPAQAAMPGVLSFTNGLYVIVYLAALATTMTLFDPATRFQVRILSPIYISLLLLLAGLGVWVWRRKTAAWRVAVVFLAIGILSMFAYSQVRFVQGLHAAGGALTGENWFTSNVSAALEQVPPEALILSNDPGVVYLYTGRPSGVLPREEPGISELKPYVLSGKIVLVLFRVNKAEPTTLAYYYELGRGLYLTDLGNTWIFSSFPE